MQSDQVRELKHLQDENGRLKKLVAERSLDKAKIPDQVAISTREDCGYCATAKELLADLGYDAMATYIRTKVVGAIAGQKTVPQVFVNGSHRRPRGPRTMGAEGGVSGQYLDPAGLRVV